ncbi:MAG: hypothetical protein EXR71_14605 [Myxococcales bacterium]|nr:hypothetical protein [Myxococcales bacterium]
MWLAVLLSCTGADEPPVRAVRPPPPTVAEVAEKREREELRASPRNVEVNYVKPPGVYIDVRFFGGRRWDNVRDLIVDQFGPLLAEEIDKQGREVKVLTRGTLTIDQGEIDEIMVPLPEPRRRPEAMMVCGFSGLSDRYLSFSAEFRVTQFQGYRRILLHRVSAGSELIDKVTAQKKQDRIRHLQ